MCFEPKSQDPSGIAILIILLDRLAFLQFVVRLPLEA